jgi:hypothetical protein
MKKYDKKKKETEQKYDNIDDDKSSKNDKDDSVDFDRLYELMNEFIQNNNNKIEEFIKNFSNKKEDYKEISDELKKKMLNNDLKI